MNKLKTFFKKFKKSKTNTVKKEEIVVPTKKITCEIISHRPQRKVLTKENINKVHLVIDDAQSNRFVLKKFLEKLGISSFEAENGESGIECLEKHGVDFFDIIWVDLKMPIMDGFQFIKHVRKNLNYQGTIIAVTGNIERESVKKCIETGADKVLSKPLILADFLALKELQVYK